MRKPERATPTQCSLVGNELAIGTIGIALIVDAKNAIKVTKTTQFCAAATAINRKEQIKKPVISERLRELTL